MKKRATVALTEAQEAHEEEHHEPMHPSPWIAGEEVVASILPSLDLSAGDRGWWWGAGRPVAAVVTHVLYLLGEIRTGLAAS